MSLNIANMITYINQLFFNVPFGSENINSFAIELCSKSSSASGLILCSGMSSAWFLAWFTRKLDLTMFLIMRGVWHALYLQVVSHCGCEYVGGALSS